MDPKLKRTTDLLDSLMITIMASVFLFFVVAVFAVIVHFGWFAILFSLTFIVAWGMIYLFISREDS